MRPFRVQDELARGKIVIVAGFQGVSYKREITTLGRGGGDTTAVALAAALGAEYWRSAPMWTASTRPTHASMSFLNFKVRAPLAVFTIVVYLLGAATGSTLLASLRRSYAGSKTRRYRLNPEKLESGSRSRRCVVDGVLGQAHWLAPTAW